MKIETILVATDFSPDGDEAIETATGLAKQLGAKIELLHAYHVDIPYATPAFAGGVVVPDGFHEHVRDAARKLVDLAAEKIADAGVPVNGHTVPGPASHAIVEAAKEYDVDLIVLGTRGLTGVKHVLLGSVAERTVRRAPCAVLTVKASYDE